MNRKIFIGLILLQCCSICRLQGNAWYSEYWQQFFCKMWENDSCRLGTYVKVDTGNHFHKIRSVQINEQFRWNVSDNFAVEVHYAYLNGRSVVPHSPWRWQHRLELEANPTFHFCRNYVVTRNRLEIRRLENKPKTLYRLRQRTMFVIPIEGMGMLKSYSLFNEVFYNISIGHFTQDRICPFQLTFALSDKIDMNLYFLVRFIRTNDIWGRSAVLGTQFSF